MPALALFLVVVGVGLYSHHHEQCKRLAAFYQTCGLSALCHYLIADDLPRPSNDGFTVTLLQLFPCKLR